MNDGAGGTWATMTASDIRVYLEDGPQAGTSLLVHPGPEGRAPHQLVVADPPGNGGRREESFDVESAPTAATTYYLHRLDESANVYVYGAEEP
jgi:hypothetical protein